MYTKSRCRWCGGRVVGSWTERPRIAEIWFLDDVVSKLSGNGFHDWIETQTVLGFQKPADARHACQRHREWRCPGSGTPVHSHTRTTNHPVPLTNPNAIGIHGVARARVKAIHSFIYYSCTISRSAANSSSAFFCFHSSDQFGLD